MIDLLLDVISASEKRITLHHKKRRNVFKLISWRYLSISDIEPIRDFQASILKEYAVYPVIIGGGYGCSIIDFEVHALSAKEASKFVRQIIKDKNFQESASKLRFKVLITQVPYERVDLASGLADGYSTSPRSKRAIKDESVNITNITNIEGTFTDSPVIIDSSHYQQIERQPNVDKALTEILERLRKDSEVTSERLVELFENIMFIKTEMRKKRPDKSRILEIVSHLSSFASVSSLAIQLGEMISRIV